MPHYVKLESAILLVIAFFDCLQSTHTGSIRDILLNRLLITCLLPLYRAFSGFMYVSDDHAICNDFIISMVDFCTKKE
jgi:hypothetical protein